jgi:hypothetical protein
MTAVLVPNALPPEHGGDFGCILARHRTASAPPPPDSRRSRQGEPGLSLLGPLLLYGEPVRFPASQPAAIQDQRCGPLCPQQQGKQNDGG